MLKIIDNVIDRVNKLEQTTAHLKTLFKFLLLALEIKARYFGNDKEKALMLSMPSLPKVWLFSFALLGAVLTLSLGGCASGTSNPSTTMDGGTANIDANTSNGNDLAIGNDTTINATPDAVAPVSDIYIVPDVGCPEGYTMCSKGCAKFSDDFQNCGDCDNPCSTNTDTKCEGGKCIGRSLVLVEGAYKWDNGKYSLTCLDYLNDVGYKAQGNANYWIDPDGTGAAAPISVTCDMAAGGYTEITSLDFIETNHSYLAAGELLKITGDGFTAKKLTKCAAGFYSDNCTVIAMATVFVAIGSRMNLPTARNATALYLTSYLGGEANGFGGNTYANNTQFYSWTFTDETSGPVTNGLIDLAPECFGYTTLSSNTRSITLGTGASCDKNLTNIWYRFEGTGGTKIPTVSPGMNKCSTAASGWLNGIYSTTSQGATAKTACFHWTSGNCQWSSSIQMARCGYYHVYNLPAAPQCNLAYCTTN